MNQSVVWSVMQAQRDRQVGNALDSLRTALRAMPEGTSMQQAQAWRRRSSRRRLVRFRRRRNRRPASRAAAAATTTAATAAAAPGSPRALS